MSARMNGFLLCIFLLLAFGCNHKKIGEAAKHATVQAFVPSDNLKKAYFASGCFWCVEAIFESVKGVVEAIPGYCGGDAKNASYSEVSSGYTKHAETVEIYYDPLIIDYKTLVKVFFGSHDATTLNRQGPDFGKQYRSIVFYQNTEEQKIAQHYIERLYLDGGLPQGTINTELIPFTVFYKAEPYHQNYERLHPDDEYIKSVSLPRLKKFQTDYPTLLKSSNSKH